MPQSIIEFPFNHNVVSSYSPAFYENRLYPDKCYSLTSIPQGMSDQTQNTVRITYVRIPGIVRYALVNAHVLIIAQIAYTCVIKVVYQQKY